MKIGIDIGGSHIGIGIVNQSGVIVKKVEYDIFEEDKANIEEFLEKRITTTLIKWQENFGEISSIGISVPGIISENVIEESFNLNLKDYNLAEKIKNCFDVKVTIQNDAKCAALAEKNLGILRNYYDCVFLCLGTGIGGAAFSNGKILGIDKCSSYEFGHMCIKKDGKSCRCGSKGCFETYASMKVFKEKIKEVLKLSKEYEGEKLLEVINNNIDKKEVIETIDEYLDDVVVGLSNIINILAPTAICIGGSFAYYKEIFLEKLVLKLEESKYIFNINEIPRILIASLSNNSGIVGSALYL